MSAKNQNPNKYLYKTQHAVLFRLKERHIKSFRFSLYGIKTYEVARLYRNQYLTDRNMTGLLGVSQTGLEGPKLSNKRNTSGVIGVCYVKPGPRSPNDGYQGHFSAGGRQINELYYIDDYGEAGAFFKACRFRYNEHHALVVTDPSLLIVPLGELKRRFKNVRLSRKK